MIRPTSIPHTLEDLILEQAVCREALRLAFSHHRRLAVGLSGVQRRRTIGDLFRQSSAESLVDMLGLDLIIGSGGVLSHAPDRKSSAFMLLDAYEPEGVTRLAVDSIFMMPHLGVFSTVDREAAAEVFVRDCLIDLGTAIAPVGRFQKGAPVAEINLGSGEKIILRGGELICREFGVGERVNARIQPLLRWADVGAGPGRTYETELIGGHAGIMLDGRGRPLDFPENEQERNAAVRGWFEAFKLETH